MAGSWITWSGGLKEFEPGTLVIEFSFKGNWLWAVDQAEVAYSWWKSYDAEGPNNPRFTETQTISTDEMYSKSDGWHYFTSTYDVPASAVYVRVWARLKWKSYQVKEGNNTVTKYRGGNPENDGWEDNWYYEKNKCDWRADTGTWPRLPPEPEYELNNGIIHVTFTDIRPLALEGDGALGYANAIRVELIDHPGNVVAHQDLMVWNGQSISSDQNNPDYNHATSASCNFAINPGEERYLRATTLRYGTGRAPLNKSESNIWFPYSPTGEIGYTNWVPHGENGIVAEPVSVSLDEVRALSSNSVSVKWKAVEKVSYYKISYTENLSLLGNFTLGSNAITSVTTENAKPPTITNFVISGLETGKRYWFVVQAVNDTGESKVSNTRFVVLGKRPNPPTTWSSTTTAKKGQKLMLFWAHNSEDNSIQEFAQLELNINGEKEILTFETPILGGIGDDNREPTDFYEIDTNKYNDGAIIKWRVRTAGIFVEGYDEEDQEIPGYSEWSIERVVEIFAPPTLALYEDPNQNGIVKSFPYHIALQAGPPSQKVLSYHLSIIAASKYIDFDPTGSEVYIGAGQEIFSFDYDPDPDSSEDNDFVMWNHTTRKLIVKLNPSNINLSNAQSYTASASVTMSTGLSTDNSYPFTVNWSEAMDGGINGSVYIKKEDLTAQISASYISLNGSVDPDVYLNFYRRTYDGNYLLLESEVINSDNAVVTDPHPPLDYANYRITAIKKSTGSVMYRDLDPAYVGEIFAVIQWDESWPEYYYDYSGPGNIVQPTWQGTMLKLSWNLDVSDKWAPQTAAVEYIGREHPVGYYGTQAGSTSSWKIDVVKADREMVAKLRRLATYKGNVYVREPYGSGYWAMVKVSFSQNHTKLVVPVTIDITRVEGGV